MKCTIVVFPSREVQERANSYRKRYDSQFTWIQPHMKLKWPFEVTDAELPALVAEIETVTSQAEPFSIQFRKIKTFYPNTRVIYFGIQDPSQLENLHNQLNQEPLFRQEKYAFTPHLTIGQDMNEDEFHDVIGRLKMVNLNYTSLVDRVHLLYQLEDQTWTSYQTFLLGKKS